MASHNAFERSEKKNRNSTNMYNRPKSFKQTTEHLSRDKKIREKIKLWASYFRANPQRFAEEYLGITLHLFQKILIYMAFHVDFFMYLASRGQGEVICPLK